MSPTQRLAACALLSVAFSCGGQDGRSSQGSRTGQLSQGAESPPPVALVSSTRTGVVLYPDDLYEPTLTGRPVETAERARTEDAILHVQVHQQEVGALRALGLPECAALAPTTASLCPMLGPVRTIDRMDDGVRLRFPPGVRVSAVLQLIRCHQAYGDGRPQGDAPHCPFFLPRVQLVQNGTAIELHSDDPSIVRALWELMAPDDDAM